MAIADAQRIFVCGRVVGGRTFFPVCTNQIWRYITLALSLLRGAAFMWILAVKTKMGVRAVEVEKA